MSTNLESLLGDERRAACAKHDAEAREFDTRLHRVLCNDPHAEGEGRQCAGSPASSKGAILGLWPLVRDAVRSLSVSDWLALAVAVTAVMATWSKG